MRREDDLKWGGCDCWYQGALHMGHFRMVEEVMQPWQKVLKQQVVSTGSSKILRHMEQHRSL